MTSADVAAIDCAMEAIRSAAGSLDVSISVRPDGRVEFYFTDVRTGFWVHTIRADIHPEAAGTSPGKAILKWVNSSELPNGSAK